MFISVAVERNCRRFFDLYAFSFTSTRSIILREIWSILLLSSSLCKSIWCASLLRNGQNWFVPGQSDFALHVEYRSRSFHLLGKLLISVFKSVFSFLFSLCRSNELEAYFVWRKSVAGHVKVLITFQASIESSLV